MVRSGIGDRPRRREDQRFLTGQGRYLDDLAFEGVAQAIGLRSPYAHAEIHAIDTAAAKAMPGVREVLTAEDVHADRLRPLLPYVDANTVTGEPFAFTPQPLLAEDKVRYVGEPVPMIVAESRKEALDAAERTPVEYAPRPAVTAVAAGAERAAAVIRCAGQSVLRVACRRPRWRGARLCRGGAYRVEHRQPPHY